MRPQGSLHNEDYIARAQEVFIRMSFLALLGLGCFILLRPFLQLIVSSIMIAIAVNPGFRQLEKLLKGRRKLAAAICTILLLLVVIVPCVLLTGTLASGITGMARQLESGQLSVPPPPASLAKLPIIGVKLQAFWNACSTNFSSVLREFSPQIREQIPKLLSASASIGNSLLLFLLSILIAGYLLSTARRNGEFADVIFSRVFGEHGPEYKEIVSGTVRSVTNGILGVAAIQTAFASVGFWLIGLPGAGLWAVFFLIASVMQIGPLVMIPAVLYVLATFPTLPAVLFLGWCVIVGLMDNILKPILIGRGSKVPMAVIFIGVLGGFIVMRLIGLFVGAIVLSVGYKLFLAWVQGESSTPLPTEASAAKAS